MTKTRPAGFPVEPTMTMREKLGIAFNPPRYDVSACLDALGFALIPLCLAAMCVISAVQHQKPALLVVALVPLGVALMLVRAAIRDLLDLPAVRIREAQMMRRRLTSPTIRCRRSETIAIRNPTWIGK